MRSCSAHHHQRFLNPDASHLVAMGKNKLSPLSMVICLEDYSLCVMLVQQKANTQTHTHTETICIGSTADCNCLMEQHAWQTIQKNKSGNQDRKITLHFLSQWLQSDLEHMLVIFQIFIRHCCLLNFKLSFVCRKYLIDIVHTVKLCITGVTCC